jgi:hypothetical protein
MQLSPGLQAHVSGATLLPMVLLGRVVHPAGCWAAGARFALGNAALSVAVAAATDAHTRVLFLRRQQRSARKARKATEEPAGGQEATAAAAAGAGGSGARRAA